LWWAAPNFTGIEGAVEDSASLPTTKFTEQNPALCGIYFSRAIRVHGAPIDKELQLSGGRCVALGFKPRNLGFKPRNLFYLRLHLGELFHLGFHLCEFVAHLRKGVSWQTTICK
jgi:hypothetical protein